MQSFNTAGKFRSSNGAVCGTEPAFPCPTPGGRGLRRTSPPTARSSAIASARRGSVDGAIHLPVDVGALAERSTGRRSCPQTTVRFFDFARRSILGASRLVGFQAKLPSRRRDRHGRRHGACRSPSPWGRRGAAPCTTRKRGGERGPLLFQPSDALDAEALMQSAPSSWPSSCSRRGLGSPVEAMAPGNARGSSTRWAASGPGRSTARFGVALSSFDPESPPPCRGRDVVDAAEPRVPVPPKFARLASKGRLEPGWARPRPLLLNLKQGNLKKRKPP